MSRLSRLRGYNPIRKDHRWPLKNTSIRPVSIPCVVFRISAPGVWARGSGVQTLRGGWVGTQSQVSPALVDLAIGSQNKAIVP